MQRFHLGGRCGVVIWTLELSKYFTRPCICDEDSAVGRAASNVRRTASAVIDAHRLESSRISRVKLPDVIAIRVPDMHVSFVVARTRPGHVTFVVVDKIEKHARPHRSFVTCVG